MATYEITFMYPGETRNQSRPYPFEATSLEDAKRQATEMVEEHGRTFRTVIQAVLTTDVDRIMKITRWFPSSGWTDPAAPALP